MFHIIFVCVWPPTWERFPHILRLKKKKKLQIMQRPRTQAAVSTVRTYSTIVYPETDYTVSDSSDPQKHFFPEILPSRDFLLRHRNWLVLSTRGVVESLWTTFPEKVHRDIRAIYTRHLRIASEASQTNPLVEDFSWSQIVRHVNREWESRATTCQKPWRCNRVSLGLSPILVSTPSLAWSSSYEIVWNATWAIYSRCVR